MTPIAGLRAWRIAAPLRHYTSVYACDAADIAAEQLRRLNAAWSESLARSPWARALQKRLNLPESFPNWEAFDRLTPVQRKVDLRSILAVRLAIPSRVLWRATGGTTAEPLRFPVFPSEMGVAALDLWLGRRRLGIAPDDRLFIIWGHSHLFGSGLKGAIAKLRRRVADQVLGYTRWNAYRLSSSDLRQAAEALLRSRARYVIGYSSALDRFARTNMGRSAEIRGLGLAAVIATAEGFPRSDSRDVISACFGCPVVMEYGSVETGPIAYERPEGGYDVFWAHHRVELAEAPTDGEVGELLVTSLTPRALPLLRYAIGDLIWKSAGQSDCATTFKAVRGRCNDVVVLPDGSPIHSEAFTHAVRDVEGLQAYQVVRCPDGRLPVIRYQAEAPLNCRVLAEIRRRLSCANPGLHDVAFERIPRIEPSLAGKHRMVVDGTGS